MFGSRTPSKPHTRSKRKRKPPWSSPYTRVTLARGVFVTLSDARGRTARVYLPEAALQEALSVLLWTWRAGRKGGE